MANAEVDLWSRHHIQYRLQAVGHKFFGIFWILRVAGADAWGNQPQMDRMDADGSEVKSLDFAGEKEMEGKRRLVRENEMGA
jgi:hypothetical protein